MRERTGPEPAAVTVREARAEDWPAIGRLLAELGRPEAVGTEGEPALREVYERYLARTDVIGLVAEIDGRVVGFCDLEYRARLNFEPAEAWIPDLIVAENARSRGAGRALLARAEELARARGCWGMSLESATWRERAHAFYVREGWTDSGKAFTKPLSDLEWPPAPR